MVPSADTCFVFFFCRTSLFIRSPSIDRCASDDRSYLNRVFKFGNKVFPDFRHAPEATVLVVRSDR